MKIKSMMAVVLAAMVGFTSCSDDDNSNGLKNEGNSVFMKIVKNGVNGRSIEAPGIGDGSTETVEITQGILYFTDATGTIKHRFVLDPTGPTDVNNDPAGSTIKIDDIVAGIEIRNIEGNVRKAYLVANEDLIIGFDLLNDDIDENISVVTKCTLPMASQVGVTSTNLKDLTLYGSGDLILRTSGTTGPNKFEVTIPVKPHVARIEIVDITGEEGETHKFEEFDIKGIFINNYYEELNMDRSQEAGKLKNFGAGGSTVYGNGNTDYPLYMYDWSDTGFGNPANALVKTADATTGGNIWAYNIFAPEEGIIEFPHVILSVSNVVTDPVRVFDEPSFVTVRGFKKDDGDLGAVTLEPGKIYRMKAGYFKFKPEHLKPKAESESIDVEVHVSLLEWSVQGIKPDLE